MKAIARYALKKLGLYGLYSLWIRGPLHDDGWFRSFAEGRSVDLEGNPIPFITYPALDFLKRRIRPEMVVFEYGSGASTLWWASHVRRVVACEHDPEWYRKVAAEALSNVTLILRPIERGYADVVLEQSEPFDIVMIDGRDRVHCARNCVQALKPGGVIIWDNSDREKYVEGFRFLHEQGFRRLEFTGPIPTGNLKSETSIFYRSDNCLGL
jgi:precorrin-6B methylase 2